MDLLHRASTAEPTGPEALAARLARLLRLELELGLAETRDFIRGLVGARWEPLLIAGGGVALLSSAALTWSVWRFRHLSWPTETLTSFEENWRWLAAQLRSRLTLRSHAA
jgi:hypothetical protein